MIFKKGVSSVVANVLIVLLVVVGVAVLWAAVKPTVDRTADTVQSDCFTVQLEPVKCEINLEPTSSDFGKVTYTVKRDVGQGDLKQLALSYSGDVIYYIPNVPSQYSSLSIAYLFAQQQAIVREDAQSLSELETIGFQESVSNNPNFNFDAILSGVSITNAALGSNPLSLASVQGIYSNLLVFYLPSTITAYAVVGDESRLCDTGTQPVTCSCTGSLCATADSIRQGTPKCTSLPCTAIVP